MAEELGVAAFSSIVSEVTKSLFGPIIRQLSYVFKYQSFVQDIKIQDKELGHKRKRVEQDVKQAERQGDEIYEDVQQWLTSVEDFTESVVKPIIEDEGEAKQRCFKGLCPNLLKRYSLSKKAVKATKEGANLLGKGNFNKVSYRSAPERTDLMHGSGYEHFDSRVQILQDVMDALKDPSVNMIGVYGMGGVGKTTLVKEVARKALEEKVFDEVVMAEVSQIPNYKEIQNKIGYDLGLEFGQHENEFERVGRLCKRLKKEKGVLVILDNVWTKVDLDAVGIPVGGNGKDAAVKKENWIRRDDDRGFLNLDALELPFGGHDKENAERKEGWTGSNNDQTHRCAVLLTSRWQDVLFNDMKTQKNFCIGVLTDQEASHLFGKLVGDSAEQSNFQPLAAEIVRKCAGLPIAITTLANTLASKSLPIWKDALDQLQMSNTRNIQGMDKNVSSIIELSYNFLEKEEAKSLFLLCSLPYTYDIPIDELLFLGMGLGLFQDVRSLDQKRNRVITLIGDLKAASLLLDGDTKGTVRMHDIIYMVSRSIASTDKHIFSILDATGLKEMLEEEIPKDSIALSLPCEDSCELPERLGFQKLKLFSLFMENSSLKIPEFFFEGLQEVRFLRLSRVHLLSPPSSLSCLVNLQTLYLDSCQLGDMAVIGELKKLEILSFCNSGIVHLPRKIGDLTRLRLLDLNNCSQLKVIAPNVISHLTRLEELYMGNSFVQWEDEGLSNHRRSNASLVELRELPRLTNLEIHVRDAKIMKADLFSQKLERYKVFIGDVWNWSGDYETSRILKLSLNKGIYLRYVTMLLKRAEDLYLDDLNGVQSVLYGLNGEGFPQLKHLHVQNATELFHIIHSVDSAPHNAFPALVSLSIHNLINLEKICAGQLTTESFGKLKIVRVKECERLKHLFSFSMAKNLLQLQEIEVTDCKNLKWIFVDENECHAHQNNWSTKLELNKLRSLTLQFLPKLMSFSLDGETSLTLPTPVALNTRSNEITAEDFITLFGEKVVFPSLEKLKLSSINIEVIWLTQLSAMLSLKTLRDFTVEGCRSLKFLFSFSVIENLEQLQRLEICNCESIEEIIYTEGFGEGMIIKRIFPKLVFLKLSNLPVLTRFCSGKFIELPSLSDLLIGECPSIEAFVFHSNSDQSASKELEKTHLGESLIQSFFDEKVGLPSLENLTLFHMDNVKKIWHDKLAFDSFAKLQALLVSDCHKLQNIFPFSILGRLHKLKAFVVIRCFSLEEIVGKEEALGVVPRLVFPQLITLSLTFLPKLKTLYSGLHISEWPVLKTLVVRACYQAEMFAEFLTFKEARLVGQHEIQIQQPLFLLDKVAFTSLENLLLSCNTIMKKKWHDKFYFSNVRLLLLESISNINASFLSCFLHTVPHLEILLVSDAFFKEILLCDGSTCEERHMEVLIKLKHLRLNHLPRLLFLAKDNSQFSKVIQNLESLVVLNCGTLKSLVPSSVSFHDLTILRVSKCDGLKKLIMLSTAKSLVKLKKLSITDCKRIEQLIEHNGDEEEDRIVFSQLKYLALEHLPRFTCFCLINCTIEFSSLEQVIVRSCPTMKVFSPGALITPKLQGLQLTEEDDQMCWEGDLNSTLQQLYKSMVGFRDIKRLKLSQFPHLKEIWHGPELADSCFSNLSSLIVDDCTNMSSAIPANLLGYLNNLETLEVRNCDLLEEVLHLEEMSANKHFGPLLPELCMLELVDLPKLERFCNFNGNIIELPSLSKILIENCPKMETFISYSTSAHMKANEELQEIMKEENFLNDIQPFFTEKIAFPSLEELHLSGLPKLMHLWKGDSQPSNAFQNLATLEVSNCDGMINLLTLSIVENLVTLRRVNITECKMMEKIIEQDREYVEQDCIIFGQLEYLGFHYLPWLECFYLGNCTLEFPSLTQVVVSQCPKMKTFSGGVVHTPKLSKVQLTQEEEYLDDEEEKNEGRWEGDLNSTIQQLFKEMVGFRDIKCLELSQFPHLKEIWHGPELVDSCFSNLSSLIVDDCMNMSSAIPANLLGYLNNLETLEVRNCDLLEEVFHLEEMSANKHFGPLFPELCILELVDLPKLERFCNFNGIIIELPSLSKISIENCPNMETFISYSTSAHMKANEELQEMMKEENFLNDIQPFFTEKIAFPSLEELHLSGLPKLMHLWMGDSQPSNAFQNLATLEVSNCDGMINLLTLSIVENLVTLRRINITECKMMEKIIEQDREYVEQDCIIFGQLEYLGFHYLPWLECFYLGNCTLEFPSLTQVVVSQCPKMKTFSGGVVHTPKLNKVQLTQEEEYLDDEEKNGGQWEGNLLDDDKGKNEWRWEGDLNSTIQQLFKEMVGFRDIEYLELSQFPYLKEIWLDPALPVSFFSNLSTLVVDDCTLVSSAIPANLLRFLSNLKFLQVGDCDALEEVFHLEEIDEHFGPLFPNLVTLVLKDLPKMKRFCNITGDMIELPLLSEMWIKNCPNMETFISNPTSAQAGIQSFFDEKVGLPSLKRLTISRMRKLKKIWQDQLTSDSFWKLNYLGILYCHKLLNIFPWNMLERLQKLEDLRILCCNSVQEISEPRALRGRATTDLAETIPSFVFPDLTFLKLQSLPRLKSFYPGLYISEWPMLNKLVVRKCAQLELLVSEFLSLQETYHADSQHHIQIPQPLFFTDKVAFPCLEQLELSNLPKLLCLWKDNSQMSKVFLNLETPDISECGNLETLVQTPKSFPNLKRLEIRKCDRLINLVTHLTAQSLVKLTRMHIAECKMITEIIKHVEEVKDCNIVFGQLEYLGLDCLPCLTSFCLGNYTLEFPSLEQVLVKECPKMKIFSEGVLDTPKLNKVQLTEDDDDDGFWEGNLNDTVRQLFKQKNSKNED